MDNSHKQLIKRAVLSRKDLSFWGNSLIRHYLKKLKEKNNQISLQLKPHELEPHIFYWVETYDNDLKIFKEINKIAEESRSKTVQFLRIGDKEKEAIDKSLNNFKEIKYDPLSTGNKEQPKIVFAKEYEDYFEFWFAANLNKYNNFKINFLEIEEIDLKNRLENFIQNEIPVNSVIEEFKIAYSCSSRIINICKIYKSEGKMEVSTDQIKITDPEDEEKALVQPEDRLKEILSTGLQHIGIKENLEDLTDEISENRKVNVESIKKIHSKETDSYLLLLNHTEQEYNQKELSERNTNKFFKLTKKNVRPFVKKYYDKNGSFKDFLEEYSEIDGEKHGRVIKEVKSIDGIEAKGLGFLFFVLNETKEKPIIEAFTVKCDAAKGILKINGEKGCKMDNLYEELDKLFS